jgi:hypothetical protein
MRTFASSLAVILMAVVINVSLLSWHEYSRPFFVSSHFVLNHILF